MYRQGTAIDFVVFLLSTEDSPRVPDNVDARIANGREKCRHVFPDGQRRRSCATLASLAEAEGKGRCCQHPQHFGLDS